MATQSSILAWKIPWTEDPEGLSDPRSDSWATEQKARERFGQSEKPDF